MKVLSGISVLALLIAGAATPSFATSLTPGTVVTPGLTAGFYSQIATTGVVPFNFGGDQGQVQEVVATFTGNPFGANDLTFFYQVMVTGGNVVNLTTGSFAIPGISIDVAQGTGTLDPSFTGTYTQAASASLTGDGTTLGFGFTPPNGLTPGDLSYILVINTNQTVFEPGVFSLQDDQTQNFSGFVPQATPEPGSLALLGTGLLGMAGVARRRIFRR